MKKIFFLASVLLASLTISAEVFTLDLSNPTDPTEFVFNANDVWESTCDSSVQSFEAQIFAFTKSLDGRSYGGTSWNGFTVSKATSGDYYANYKRGGVKGVGSPYVLAYYNEWWLMDPNNDDATSSNKIIFNDGNAYYPRYVYLNNVLISYSDIMNGNDFGGRAFKKGDKFGVKIEGLDDEFYPDGSEVTYLLADYTSDNEEEWFVNTEWAKVDLTELGAVYGLQFTVFSTDQGMYGTNTATYFALDGLTVSTLPTDILPAGFENEAEGINVAHADTCWQGATTPAVGTHIWSSGDYNFASYTNDWGEWGVGYNGITVSNEKSNEFNGFEYYRSAKGGAYEGNNFAVWNDPYKENVDAHFSARVVPGFFVNNSAYAANSMNNGDSYAKKFDATDWFKLTITGSKEGSTVGSVDFYLAQEGKYVNEWTYVDLSTLGEIDAIKFSLSSSDASAYGMNTPAYFCMDNFGFEKPEGYVVPAMAEFDLSEGVENVNAAVKATKVLRNGQIIIVRGDAEYTVIGQTVK
jgi:hypothetical protein